MTNINSKRRRTVVPTVAACALAIGVLPASLPAQADGNQPQGTAAGATETMTTAGEERAQAQRLVQDATSLVDQMKQDQQIAGMLSDAKGVYIVPEFGRGAFIVGAAGGAGVMTAQQAGSWSSPAFYNFGSISLGAQAGGSGGSIAFLLMSDEAVNAFKGDSEVTLSAEAGYTIVDASANTQGAWGDADVIVWSDTVGAYAGATVSVSNVNWDEDSNRAFYGKEVELSQLLSGEVKDPTAQQLTEALPQ